MEKQWFVIRNEKHIGPYDLDSLSSMHKSGKVELDTLVWREGWDEAKSYKALLQEIFDEVSLPPPVPSDAKGIRKSDSVEDPLVDEKSKDDREQLEHVEQEEDPEEEIEQEIVDEVETAIVVGVKAREKLLRFNFDWRDFVKPFSFFILLASVSFVSFFIIVNKVNEVSRPAQMNLSDFKSLTTFLNKKTKSDEFEFYLSKNRSTIWMGTNNSHFGEVVLKFSSVYGRHLGDVETEAISYGTLDNNIATFDQITFTRGEKIVEGFYNIEVHTPKPLSLPFSKKFSYEGKRDIDFKDIRYIGALKIDKFEAALALKNKREQSNEKKFWEELREKYLTIKMITVQIQTAMNEVFKDSDKTWKEKVAIFENEYKSKYGDFFTSFVLANEKSYNELEKKDFPDKLEVISNYARLSRIAKAIGISTMDSLNLFESTDDGDKLEEQVKNKFQGIVDLCDQKMMMINKNKI